MGRITSPHPFSSLSPLFSPCPFAAAKPMLPRIQPAGIAAVTPIICLLFHFYYSCILIYASIEIFWLNCMAWANILLILHRYVSSAAFYPGSSEMPHRLFPRLILLYPIPNTLPCLFRIRSCYVCILHTVPATPKFHICILIPINSASEIYHRLSKHFSPSGVL